MARVPQNELGTGLDQPISPGFTNRALALAAGAGTDFYTINFVRLISAGLSVSTEGQRTFNHVLLNAPRFACADERLQFGFGDKHLFKTPGVQMFEYEHIVLASALGEFFGEDYAALIFSGLADGFENDDRPKPLLSAFKAFVGAISGMLSLSEFSILVDERIRLNPFNDHGYDTLLVNEYVPPSKIVDALHMLVKLKSGAAGDLRIYGGDVLAWFSVYGEMFLGINTVLLDSSGKELYRGGGVHTRLPTVSLIFVPPNTNPPDQPATSLWLRQPMDPTTPHPFLPPKSTGRITWESLFSKAFGPAFHTLDQTEARTFGTCLGGIARNWELMAQRSDVQPWMMSPENKTDLGSQGLGLIQTWTNWFPELRHLQGRMERGLKLDLEGANKACMDGVHHLEHLCSCYLCNPSHGPDPTPATLPKHHFCIPTIMETIIMLGLSLSRVILASDLYPSRAGVLAAYTVQAQKRTEIKRRNAMGPDRSYILFNQDYNAAFPQKLRNLVAMFSGIRPTEEVVPENLVAYSHEGVTAYVLGVQRGNGGGFRDDDNVIRVVTGPINWGMNVYKKLCLGPVRPPATVLDGWEGLQCDHLKEMVFVK